MNMEPLELRSGIPLFKQVASRIKKFVRSGDFKGGDRIPTPVELGKKLKVNELTVRRGIRLLIESGFLYTIKGKGTFVTPKAVEKTVLWVFGLDEFEGIGTYDKEIFQKGRDMLLEAGYEVEICRLPADDKFRIKKIHDRIAVSPCDGYVFSSCESDHPLCSFVRKSGGAYTGFGDSSFDRNWISTDIADGFRQSFQYLERKGHTDVTVVCRRSRESSHAETVELLKTYLPAGSAMKLNAVSIFLTGSLEYVGYEVARELLANSKVERGLVVADDQLARGVSRAILSNGFKCNDFVVISSETNAFPLGLPVTYVGPDAGDVAKAGIDMLLKHMLGTSNSGLDFKPEYRFRHT